MNEKKMEELMSSFWGSSEHDIADEVSELYEDVSGLSSVYWTHLNGENTETWKDSLADRPDVYSTNGFTGAFETWGLDNVRLAVECGCMTKDEVLSWFCGRFQKKVYAFYVEDHDENNELSCSVEDGCRYSYWYADGIYSSLEQARERMREAYMAYRDQIQQGPDAFAWEERTYKGRRVWECLDRNWPRGWKIVEWEVK